MNRFLIIHSEKDDEWPRDSYLDYIEMSINPEPGSYIHSSNLESIYGIKLVRNFIIQAMILYNSECELIAQKH